MSIPVLSVKDDKGNIIPIPVIKGDKGDAYVLTEADKEEIANMVNLPIDQTYSPESENAQSGIAVAEALDNKDDLKISNSEQTISFDVQGDNLIASVVSKSGTEDELDLVAYDGKTYRDIFITNNLVDIGDCENGLGTAGIHAGTPETAIGNSLSGSSALKCFGTSGQIIKYNIWNDLGLDKTKGNKTLYAACSAKIERYTKGVLGVQIMDTTLSQDGLNSVNTNFARASVVKNVLSASTAIFYIGSINSANLDGYIDDIALIDLSMFSVEPNKATMDYLYDNYIKIITGQGVGTEENASVSYIIGQTVKDDNYNYTDEECISAFMEKVNEKAQELGMANSSFITPSGADKLSGITEITEENNRSTAKDLVRLFVGATAYNDLMKVWGKPSKTIYTKNENPVQHDFTSVMYADMNTDEGTNTTAKSPYYFMGGKTGTWIISGYSTYNFGAICKVKDKLVVGVVMKASSNANRYNAINKLFEAAEDIIENGNTTITSVASNSACCCILPEYNVNMYENYPFEFLFEQNADVQILPASVTKVITSMVMLDYVKDLDETIAFKSTDIDANGSGNVFSAGDIITYKDALYALMLASSNMTAQAIARCVGRKVLEKA